MPIWARWNTVMLYVYSELTLKMTLQQATTASTSLASAPISKKSATVVARSIEGSEVQYRAERQKVDKEIVALTATESAAREKLEKSEYWRGFYISRQGYGSTTPAKLKPYMTTLPPRNRRIASPRTPWRGVTRCRWRACINQKPGTIRCATDRRCPIPA